ncbi:hypothetical protein Q7P37_002407 [Cladosporium fusiforme]
MSKDDERPSVDDTSSEEESTDNDSTPEEPATPLNNNQSIPIVTKWLQNVHLEDILNADKLETNRKQLLFITSYLRGPAYEWILPHLEDFLEHPKFEDLKNTTKVIMAGKAAFFTELQTEFLTQVVKTNWDDQAIASHFYRGLKDPIKDEIARRETRPATAREMYEVAMKIDERIYERQMEKRGGNFYCGNNANTKAKREVPK